MLRVGVIHTPGSVCRCAEAIACGLRSLGHEPVLADSEQMESLAWELSRGCDLIIDHTDTFRGRGLYRALIRMLLETRGARLVGSGGQACLLADDKSAAKARLAAAGIPTPPGIVVSEGGWSLPSWLRPPLVLKPAFEHMSRGLELVRSESEARSRALALWERFRQPILVETFVPGRELAVPVLDGPHGLEVLPLVDMRAASAPGVLGEAFKRVEFQGERDDVRPAKLPALLRAEVEGLARQAFGVLGLRDYARFDVRLSPQGTCFFLEANTTPSMEPFEAFAISARWAGLAYPELIRRMLESALRRCGEIPRPRRVQIDLPAGPVELEVAPGVHAPPESSVELARMLDVRPGERVLDLGCGSGLLAIASAKLGADFVVATDMDPLALAITEANARRNGLAHRIEVRAGSWYEAVNQEAWNLAGERFHVIIATPPQTPGSVPFGPKYGGTEGTRHLLAAIQGASAFLDPAAGRLWLLAISLANPRALESALQRAFADVMVVRETLRPFTREEYDAVHPGLFRYLDGLRRRGKAEFQEIGDGRYGFRNRVIRAGRPRDR